MYLRKRYLEVRSKDASLSIFDKIKLFYEQKLQITNNHAFTIGLV